MLFIGGVEKMRCCERICSTLSNLCPEKGQTHIIGLTGWGPRPAPKSQVGPVCVPNVPQTTSLVCRPLGEWHVLSPVQTLALCGHGGCIGVKVFTQRPLGGAVQSCWRR